MVDDATANKTFEYRETGNLAESYSLNTGNTAPRGAASTIANDKVWEVDAKKKVYVYNTSGGLLGSWSLGSQNLKASVQGIATNGTDVWVVDAYADKVFKYAGAARHLDGSQYAASSFSLNTKSGNKSPTDTATAATVDRSYLARTTTLRQQVRDELFAAWDAERAGLLELGLEDGN